MLYYCLGCSHLGAAGVFVRSVDVLLLVILPARSANQGAVLCVMTDVGWQFCVVRLVANDFGCAVMTNLLTYIESRRTLSRLRQLAEKADDGTDTLAHELAVLTLDDILLGDDRVSAPCPRVREEVARDESIAVR